jgi:hypothetical protein
MAESKALLDWRAKQKRGAIMKPATFEDIVQKAMKRYGLSRERAEKIAGKAYWNAARKKFRKPKAKSGNEYTEVLSKK